MREQQKTTAGRTPLLYWTLTGLLCLGMFAGGLGQVLHLPFNVEGSVHLGYPLYFLSIIGAWKIAGVIVLLAPGFLLPKEWAYAGFFFAMSGAVISHIASGDGFSKWIAPFLFACLTVASWYLRPAHRRFAASL